MKRIVLVRTQVRRTTFKMRRKVMEKFSTELEFIIMMEFMEFWIWVFVPLCTATFLFASAFRCFFLSSFMNLCMLNIFHFLRIHVIFGVKFNFVTITKLPWLTNMKLSLNLQHHVHAAYANRVRNTHEKLWTNTIYVDACICLFDEYSSYVCMCMW